MVIYPLFGALAQLVAHNTGSVGVRSSNLLCSTIHEKSEPEAGRQGFGFLVFDLKEYIGDMT